MDTDLDRMTPEELVAEVKKLRQGIREHRAAAAMNSVGTILSFGVYCRKKQIRCLWYLNCQSSYEAA
jgi:hypothetical protein